MSKPLPSTGPASTLKPAPAGATPAVSFQRRVLIAEDNELTCQQLKTLLEGEGDLRVDTTRDGKQALEALRQNFYSIFLTDLKMPHLDGMQLIEEIQKQDIPVTVIVMTGYGSIAQAVQAMSMAPTTFWPSRSTSTTCGCWCGGRLTNVPCATRSFTCASSCRRATLSSTSSARAAHARHP